MALKFHHFLLICAAAVAPGAHAQDAEPKGSIYDAFEKDDAQEFVDDDGASVAGAARLCSASS